MRIPPQDKSNNKDQAPGATKCPLDPDNLAQATKSEVTQPAETDRENPATDYSSAHVLWSFALQERPLHGVERSR